MAQVKELPKQSTEAISSLLAMNGICKKSRGLLEKLEADGWPSADREHNEGSSFGLVGQTPN